MQIKNISMFFIVLMILNLNCKRNTIKPDNESSSIPENNNLEVLFIGSSYFSYNELKKIFKNLVTGAGKQVIIGDQITQGFLADHAGRSSTEAKINERNWDYVILQGVGSLTAYPDYYTHHPVFPALDTLQNKILKNCSSSKMVFCLPWAFEDGMTWIPGWTDTYSDMQLKIYNNTIKWADSLNFVISPVGCAWDSVLSEKNYPLHYLHMNDWNHPSQKGSYLMACVIYSTVYKESAAGISYYGGLSKEEAEYFQTIASNTVLKNPNQWHIY